MDGKGETRALQRHLETLCRVTGSASSARAEMEFLLQVAPDDPEAHKRYVELVKAGDGVELDSQRKAFQALEQKNEPQLHEQYRRFLKTCAQPSVAYNEFVWMDQSLPAGSSRSRGLERYRRLIEHSGGVGWEQRRAAFKNVLLSTATPSAPAPPPALKSAQDEIARLTGDSALAARELSAVIAALPPSAEQDKQLKRYVKLLEKADGVELASVREAFVKLEQANDPKLRESFDSLLKACGGNAARALSEWRWIDSQQADMARYARLLSQSEGASPDQVRNAYLHQTDEKAQPPRLKRAHQEIARLTGDEILASRELDALVAALPPSNEPDKQLDRYLELAEKADGMQLPSVREAFVKLEQSGDKKERQGFEKLLEACDADASRALSEWKWLETVQGDLTRYAQLLSQSGDASTAQVHQAYVNLQGHQLGKGQVQDALADGSILGLRKLGLNGSLSRLEDLLGDRGAAAQELQFALSQVKPGQDQGAVIGRYVELLEKADGVGVASVREAFPLTEDPKVYRSFLALLETGRQEIAPALSELKWLGQNADDIDRYRSLLEVTGERSSALMAAYPILKKLPARAIEQLRPLLSQGLRVDEAARDLETLYTHLPAGEDPAPVLRTLERLRAEAGPDQHQGVRAALTRLLKAPAAERKAQEKNYQLLLEVEGDPNLALQDLEWLVADARGDLTQRTRSYTNLLAESSNSQREPIRQALQELAATPGPPPRTGLWARLWGSTSREEAFEKLYRMQDGNAAQAMKDLKAIEFHLDPNEDLKSALKEFEQLLEQTGEPTRTRQAFEAIRGCPSEERKEFKKELFALGSELGDLELARRSLQVVRGSKKAEEREKRMQALMGWAQSEKSASAAVAMLEASANLMINSQGIEAASAQVTAMRKKGVAPELLNTLTYAAARCSRMPGSPYPTPDETLSHYVELFGHARSASEVSAIEKILEGPGAGKVHDRSQVVAGILKGLSRVEGCREELAYLGQALQPDEFLSAGKAYAHLFATMGAHGMGASGARSELEWARELKRTKVPAADLSTILTRLTSKILIGSPIDKARAMVEEEMSGGQIIGEKDEWVIIGGTRVRRARGEGAQNGAA